LEVVSTHIPLQDVWPAGQVRQSVLAALQLFGQLWVLAAQVPEPLQTAVLVLVVPVHDAAAPQGVPEPTFPLSRQVMLPVVHDVVPVLHGLVGGWQLWLGVQAPQVPPRQNRFAPHVAPSAAWAQAPEPLQVPVWQFAVEQAGSVAVAGLLVQVPGVPRLQAWQAGQLAVPQHTPFTQLPMAHSLPVVHARPRGLAAWHFPPLQ
jgi:hypothetical protein